MKATMHQAPWKRWATIAAFGALAGCSTMQGWWDSATDAVGMGHKLTLSGANEVPPVTTQASATGSIKVADDGAVTGSITTSGLTPTMAHIHQGAVGTNGPVIIPLVKTADNVWSVTPNAKLTPDQMKAYQAGNLYVNVHTVANKGGEIRAQLKP